jgi:hypothetical protein
VALRARETLGSPLSRQPSIQNAHSTSPPKERVPSARVAVACLFGVTVKIPRAFNSGGIRVEDISFWNMTESVVYPTASNGQNNSDQNLQIRANLLFGA